MGKDPIFFGLSPYPIQGGSFNWTPPKFSKYKMRKLTDSNKQETRRYGPLRGPTSSSCGGLRPSAEAFFALRAKKVLILLFWPIFGDFWCLVVTLVTFSSNLREGYN